MRDTIRLAVILPALLLTSCAHLYAGIVADKVAGDQLEIASYRGRFVERYRSADAPDGEAVVVREVTYREPGLVRVEVIAPADRAGELLVYDRSTLTMWWPDERFGIVIRGVEAPSAGDYEDLLAEDTVWSWKNYRFSYRGYEELLDRDVTVWNAVPKRDDPLRYPYRAWTDSEYSIPLVMEVMDAPDRLWYSMRFEQLEFDCPVAPELFEVPMPDDAVVVEWDLDDPGVPLDELRAGLNFELLLPPDDLPGGLALDRVLAGRARAPAAPLLYRHEGRGRSVTDSGHFGGMLERGSGIPVDIGGEPGALNLMGTFSSVSWNAGATAVTLIGNLPYPEMVAVAERMQASAPPAAGPGLLALQSYRGHTVERRAGQPDAIERDVLYQAPGRFRVETTAPAAHAGEVFAFDGETLTMWWPGDEVAVRIRGAAAPTAGQVADVLAEATQWALRHYAIAYDGAAEQAGRPVDRWTAEPTGDSPLLLPYQTWLDRGSALPLRHEIREHGQLWYAVEFEDIELDVPVPDDAFALPLPADTLVLDWDLGAAPVTADEVQARLNFDLLLPDALPHGPEVRKIVGDERGLPVATLLMGEGGRWLSLTETRHYGVPLDRGTGIPVLIGDHRGSLDLMGTFCTVSWSVGNTALTLIGNLPFPEMVEIAAAVQPGEGRAVEPLAVDSFRGRYTEEQAGAPTVVRDVVYAAPGKARVEVVSPRSRAGETLVYDGESLVMWWPRHMFGVRIRGAVAPSAGPLHEAMRDNALWSLRSYTHEYRGSEPLGGREVDRWRLEPADDRPYLFSQDVALDRVTSLPLEVHVRDAEDSPWYAMRFDAIEFGEPVEDRTFSQRLPGNAVVFDWDLGDPGVPLDELQRRMNFRILLPATLPDGLQVDKIIRGRHDLPMVAVLMEGDGHQLSLTQTRHTGLPHGRGLGTPVELGDRTGYLNLMGGFTSIAWTRGNTALTLIGTLPYPEMIAIAASVAEPDDAALAARSAGR